MLGYSRAGSNPLAWDQNLLSPSTITADSGSLPVPYLTLSTLCVARRTCLSQLTGGGRSHKGRQPKNLGLFLYVIPFTL
jgi:hypothetical protein